MSNSRPDPKKEAEALLDFLRLVKNDRGAMADLRRALNPAQKHRAWPLLARVDGIDNPRVEVIAGLFAYHPDETHGGNLGTTCRRLALENSTFESRFTRLLACDYDEICERLRPVILAAKSKGISVNYEQLFIDLSYWGERVKAGWAKEYWGAGEADPSGAPLAEEAVP